MFSDTDGGLGRGPWAWSRALLAPVGSQGEEGSLKGWSRAHADSPDVRSKPCLEVPHGSPGREPKSQGLGSPDFQPHGGLTLGPPPSLPSGRAGASPSSLSLPSVELKETRGSTLKPGVTRGCSCHHGGGQAPLHRPSWRKLAGRLGRDLAMTWTFELSTWKSPQWARNCQWKGLCAPGLLLLKSYPAHRTLGNSITMQILIQ